MRGTAKDPKIKKLLILYQNQNQMFLIYSRGAEFPWIYLEFFYLEFGKQQLTTVEFFQIP